ncbi:MAG TPA: FHA domain-containing protein [Phycisphaerae bacterium]|nr:FHA domain-containing protein [Phycisphaerae bacterium]
MSTIQQTTASGCVGLRLAALTADGPQSDCPLNHVISILGSGDACDVILESEDVAAAHAAIVKYAGSGYLCDLGARGGALLNGQLVRWARLASGDRVKIGAFEFRVEVDGESSNAAIQHPIFALHGDEEFGLITSIDPVLLIGSDGGSDVVIKDAGVHPRHCLIVWTDRGPVARDLTGDRLTFVDGRPVAMALLQDGNTIGVGSYEFIFEVENEPTYEQSIGGRFSDSESPAAPDTTSAPLAGMVTELVAGKYADRNDATGRAEITNAAPQGPAITDFERANYFGQIVEDAGSSLSRLAEAESNDLRHRADSNADQTEIAEQSESQECDPLPESTKGLSPEAILRKAENLQMKTAEMRRRVSEAQRALDARAQKHREEILRERQRLREKRALLQMQAKALVEASKGGNGAASEGGASKSVALRGDGDPRSVLEIHDQPAQSAFVEYVAGESQVRRLVSGDADFLETTDFNVKETERLLNDPRSYADEDSIKTLEERVAELIRVAQAERKEIERGEALVETLRFETERQRRGLTRRQEKLKGREMSLEQRFRSLTTARESIRKERSPLLARLKTLDAEEGTIRERLTESEHVHQELVRESESIDELQESLEARERALLHKLELERQRLLARQSELKRKAAKLAKAAREKRMSIEKEMVRQQADLEAREAELRTRRIEIEDVARGEMEKTAGELEQVLGVRLSEIESELEARRIDLDTKVQELAGLNHAHLRATREANDPIDAPLRRIASEFNTTPRIVEEETEPRHEALDHLEAEIDAFSRARRAAALAEAAARSADAMADEDAAAATPGLGLDAMQRSWRIHPGPEDGPDDEAQESAAGKTRTVSNQRGDRNESAVPALPDEYRIKELDYE